MKLRFSTQTYHIRGFFFLEKETDHLGEEPVR